MNDELQLRVAKITHSTSADGVGLRNSLYVSGCDLMCEGCHNRHIWDINKGAQMSIEEAYQSLIQDDFNVSILGGEPFMQYPAILALCKLIKERHPNKTIWLWSGYTYEYIKRDYADILPYLDVLIDGPFIQALYEPNLMWRGSSNQRIIDLKQKIQ